MRIPASDSYAGLAHYTHMLPSHLSPLLLNTVVLSLSLSPTFVPPVPVYFCRVIRQEARDRLERETGEKEERDDKLSNQMIDPAADGTASRPITADESLSLPAHMMRRQLTQGHVVRHEKLHHLLVKSRPATGKMRFRIEADRRRSRAYPMHPAEDRPELLQDAGLAAYSV